MLFWIALCGRALAQFSRFLEIHFGREKPEHANAPIVSKIAWLVPCSVKSCFAIFAAHFLYLDFGVV